MTRTSRLFVLIAAAALPMIAACSASPTAPNTIKPLHDGGRDSVWVTDSAGHSYWDWKPWG